MKDILLEILSDVRPDKDFSKGINFIENALLDSLDILTLLSELEIKFGIKISGENIIPENFDSLEVIENLILRSK